MCKLPINFRLLKWDRFIGAQTYKGHCNTTSVLVLYSIGNGIGIGIGTDTGIGIGVGVGIGLGMV